MLDNFNSQGYFGLNLNIEKLNKINFFVGENGIGKSRVLDLINFNDDNKNKFIINHSNYLSLSLEYKDYLLRLMKILNDDISDILLKDGCFKIEEHKQLKSLIDLGYGFKRFLELVNVSIFNKPDIVLTDDIEIYFHPYYQKIFSQIMLKIFMDRNENMQLFATTNSFEMIKNFYSAFEVEKKENLISVYRLQHDENNRIVIVEYSGESLRYAVEKNTDVM